MYNFSIVVCGCTKNSGHYIRHHLQLLYALKEEFQQFQMIIYENDSIDNTCEQLLSFRDEHKEDVKIISETNISMKYNFDDHYDMRTQSLAHGRNKLLNYIHNQYSNYNLMMMVDLDNIISTFQPKQLRHVFYLPYESWDALFANCVCRYYDIWALRITPEQWNPQLHGRLWNHCIDYDCWEMAKVQKDVRRCVYQHQVTIPVQIPMIPVTSAFGGMGIYKINKTKDCFYSSKDNGISRCEHVRFHQGMIEQNKAQLFILPSLLVNCAFEHLGR
jgi:hypothetical protein